MQAEREHDRIRLKANALEAQILEQLLRLILKHYQLKPSELDARIAEAWYSTRGCKTGAMTEEETADWIESLHGLKTGHVRRLEEWIAKLASRQAPPVMLEMTFAEAASLLTILNDYRLLLAARHGIGEREMGMHLPRALHELPDAQQSAVCQIDFVGFLIEDLLRTVAPDASRWAESSED